MNIAIAVLTEATSRRDIMAALNALVRLNEYLFKTRRLPPLYESGIVYVRESDSRDPQAGAYPSRVDRWQLADVLSKTLRGDCEDLCLYRVGWLRAHGERANFRLTRRGSVWHVTVFRGDGAIEDPSKRLGMR